MEEATPKTAEIEIVINNEHGLHARPADLFVRCANSYQSAITVCNLDRNPEKKANAKSILGLLSVGVHQGNNIRIAATGEDSDEAVKALCELIASNFGE